jgi:hypothetical protein
MDTPILCCVSKMYEHKRGSVNQVKNLLVEGKIETNRCIKSQRYTYATFIHGGGGIKPEVTHADKVLESAVISVTQSIQSARLYVQSSELGPTTPSPARECCSSPLWVQGGGDTFACGVEGVGRLKSDGVTDSLVHCKKSKNYMPHENASWKRAGHK